MVFAFNRDGSMGHKFERGRDGEKGVAGGSDRKERKAQQYSAQHQQTRKLGAGRRSSRQSSRRKAKGRAAVATAKQVRVMIT